MLNDEMLVRAGWLVTGALDPVLRDAALRLGGGLVAEVGGWSELRARYPDLPVLGGPHDAVLPGLVNAHHHSHGVSSLQQGVEDDLLEAWLLALLCLRGCDRRLATLLAAARQMRGGVTACVDVLSAGGTAEHYARELDAALGAYDEAGMRVGLAAGFRSASFLVHGAQDDQRFLAALPDEARALAQRLLPAAGQVDEADWLALMDERVTRWRGHERVAAWFGPPGPQWVSDALLQKIAARAATLGTGVQTHAVESMYEGLHGPREWGRSTIEHLHALGVLGPRFSIAHGTWLTEAEIELLAATGAAVSHNPSSNLRLRAGIAPLPALLAAGVTVGLGMDGTTLDDDEDIWTEMRLALRLNRSPRIGDAVATPSQVLAMATTGGARLMGLEQRIGQLQPGYAADLLVLDTQRACWPWVAEQVDLRSLLVQRAKAGDVRCVLVHGEVVMRDGRPTRFDEQAVARELAERLRHTPYPHDGAHLARVLDPHVREWYAGYALPTGEPWIQYNARH
ncbi:MAG: amidohydrolase family protein [Burkholderiaceae bacterium]